MKIAFVAGEYQPFIGGGAGFSSKLLVHQLRKSGIIVDVYVFAGKHEPVFTESGSTNYFNSVVYRNYWPLLALHTAVKLWNKLGEYDLVHVVSTVRMAAMGFLKMSSPDVPIVATLNGEEAACLNYKKWMNAHCRDCTLRDVVHCSLERKKWMETRFIPSPVLFSYFVAQKRLAQKLDRYFAVSETMKEMYAAAGFPRARIRVMPEMYNPQFLEKLQEASKLNTNGKIVILYVGRLSREKGVDDLIRAFSKISSNNIALWIVGTGPQKDELRNIASASGVSSRIRFFGWVSSSVLPAIYKSANIFVHPGKWPEPFGITILEAMLAKLAIVTSNVGAPPETLGDSGIFYDTGDRIELAEKLEMLIVDTELRAELGLRAYDKAIKNYPPDIITNQIIQEYEKLAG